MQKTKSIFLILILIIGYNSLVFAQEIEKKRKKIPIIKEVTLSLNRTAIINKNTHNKFGFGVGLYSVFFNPKRCNFIIGLEYNRNALFKDSMDVGNFAWHYNLKYTINNFGLPVCFRVNMGEKTKFFVEAGAFIDFFIMWKKRGESVTYYSKTKKYTNQFDYKDYTANFGISTGIGLRIPVQKYEILLKSDYKWGIRDLNINLYSIYWRFTVGFGW